MKILLGIFANWKTTLAGVAGLLIALGTIGSGLKLAASGDFAGAYVVITGPEGIAGVTAAIAGLIGLFSRDADKTSKASGAE